jgi:hypothetical protein
MRKQVLARLFNRSQKYSSPETHVEKPAGYVGKSILKYECCAGVALCTFNERIDCQW